MATVSFLHFVSRSLPPSSSSFQARLHKHARRQNNISLMDPSPSKKRNDKYEREEYEEEEEKSEIFCKYFFG